MLERVQYKDLNNPQNWIDKPQKQVVEEMASLSMETNRIPDPYTFEIRNGLLFSPEADEYIEKIIIKNTRLGQLEYQAFLQIQNWCQEKEEGLILWFSPPFEDIYENSKVVISEINNNKYGKSLFNRAVVLDIGDKDVLQIASQAAREEYNNPEKLRKTPIFLSKKDIFRFIDILKRYTDQTEYFVNGEDIKIKNEKKVEIASLLFSVEYYHSGNSFFDHRYVIAELQRRGVMGEHQGSCSGNSTIDTAFNIFSNNSLDTNESYFNCPKCHKPIPSGMGITTCPHCGAKKSDYSSCV